jgi:DNA topoisomerase VI subunit B
MSGRIGRYTYKNESVLKEFLGSLFRALGSRKANQVTKKLSKDPEMKKLLKSLDDKRRAVDAKIAKRRKEDPEYDKFMTQHGI